MTKEPLGIGLIGCGTVGSGVARLLLEQPGRLASRAGRPLSLRRVLVRDVSKSRAVDLSRDLLTSDLRAVLDDPSIGVAVELVGGVDWARRAVLDLLAARKHDRAVAFEAAVAGGIPIVAALSQSLSANQIISLQGILNGTCNFILTAMSDQGWGYSEALVEAQKRGYAESDPTLDVDGTDAAHKLAILAQIAFGVGVSADAIEHRGIAGLHQNDIRYARELGYTIRLLAEAWLDTQAQNGKQLALHVSPVLLRHLAPLAQVRGAYNAIHVIGDPVGDTLYYGLGAGQMPTASAVVADIIDLAVGRAQQTFRTLRLWCSNGAGVGLRPSSTVRCRFYLRVLVRDRPGVLGLIARELARQEISISSVIQHEALDEHEGDIVPLVIMTHTALTGNFRAALAGIDSLGCVNPPSVYFPVAD